MRKPGDAWKAKELTGPLSIKGADLRTTHETTEGEKKNVGERIHAVLKKESYGTKKSISVTDPRDSQKVGKKEIHNLSENLKSQKRGLAENTHGPHMRGPSHDGVPE